MRCSESEMRAVEGRIRRFIKEKRRLPDYATMTDMDTGKPVKVLKTQYCGMYYSDYNFWLKNNRHPNFVTLNVLKEWPMYWDHQNNAYQCGPCSLGMISSMQFKPMKEGTMGVDGLAKAFGTTKTSGTPEENFINRGPTNGFNIKRIARNPTAVLNELNQYKGVMCHYQTGPADCSGFQNDYGHYAVFRGVANGRYTIYDPTRGIFTCSTSEMDKATNGRNIYYLSVELI